MSEQNYSSHRKWVPMYHFFLALLTVAVLIGSFVNLFKSTAGEGFYSASLLAAIAVGNVLMFLFLRTFALKAQDRAIRAEENFRHYLMDGKSLDAKLTMRQIIGLRFASDGEFLELEKRAVAENLSEDEIKKAIKNWRVDNYRA